MAKYIDIKRFQAVCLKIYFYTVKKKRDFDSEKMHKKSL